MDCQFDGGRIIQQLGSGYWQKPEDNLILLLAKSIHKTLARAKSYLHNFQLRIR